MKVTTKMINGPEIWNKLLEVAPKGSVLMGGAVRDYILYKEPKDYDIFYPHTIGLPEIPGWTYKENPDQVAHQAEYDIMQEPGEGIQLKPNSPIAAVWDYEVVIGKKYDVGTWGYKDLIAKVQLIGLHYDKVTKHFKNFDHTLTLGMYRRENGMFVDSRLFESIYNETVTCTNNARPEKALARAKSVVQRINPNGAEFWNYQGF